MSDLEDLILSGHVIDLALAVLVVEIAIFVWRRRSLGQPLRLAPLIVSALPGACLLMALRSALSGAGWIWVAAFLALSLPAHLVDLSLRPP